MGLFDVFLKKSTTETTRPQKPTIEQSVNQVYKQTAKQIVDELNRSPLFSILSMVLDNSVKNTRILEHPSDRHG